MQCIYVHVLKGNKFARVLCENSKSGEQSSLSCSFQSSLYKAFLDINEYTSDTYMHLQSVQACNYRIIDYFFN
jgi:hypothetical protein